MCGWRIFLGGLKAVQYLIMSEYDMLAMGQRQPGHDTWHFDHCIDYVRQLLLCGGDMALAGETHPMGVRISLPRLILMLTCLAGLRLGLSERPPRL